MDLRETILMTNICNPAWDDPGHPWKTRRPILKKDILSEKPSIIVANEGYTALQREEFATDVGLLHHNGSGDTYSYWTDGRNIIGWDPAIWSHREKSNKVMTMTQWTLPKDVSRRLMTCQLRHLKTGKVIRVSATHLTAAGQYSKLTAALFRVVQAKFIATKLRSFGYGPHILAGDLASYSGAIGQVRYILTKAGWIEDMRDPKVKVANRDRLSHHKFKQPWPKGARVSYILRRSGNSLRVAAAKQVWSSGSDHSIQVAEIVVSDSGTSTL